MLIEQLNEHTPHCTQRPGAGTTQAVERSLYLALSESNQPTCSGRPSPRPA